MLISHGTLEHGTLGDWALDPVAIAVTVGVIGLYVVGRRPGHDAPWRLAAVVAGVLVSFVAVVSPLHVAAERSLAWHMVQHVLLIGVTVPLLAVAAPWPALARGLGVRGVGAVSSARRRVGLDVARMRRLRSPLARWLLFVVVFWGWHSARLYSLAVENEWVHTIEHVSFVVAALLVWSAVLGPERAGGNADPAIRVLVAFLLGLQGVLLSALLTFAPSPWYGVYVDRLGVDDALADQHIAGVLMWVPLGALITVAGIWAAMTWIGPDDEPDLVGSGVGGDGEERAVTGDHLTRGGCANAVARAAGSDHRTPASGDRR
ncbi:MAG: cytochrome c oxidase assembly protein [Ilumatobacter fluminis]|uniref:cytochrome c oxidase assembly protein n=1 Tax=Ilumatobacter fluminis TaxID=467091 RepID=UPI0032EB86D2